MSQPKLRNGEKTITFDTGVKVIRSKKLIEITRFTKCSFFKYVFFGKILVPKYNVYIK